MGRGYDVAQNVVWIDLNPSISRLNRNQSAKRTLYQFLGIKFLDQRCHVIELLYDLKILVAPKRNSCSMRRKSRHLVPKDAIDIWHLHFVWLVTRQQEVVADGPFHSLQILVILKKHIQQDIELGIPDRRKIGKLEMPLLYSVFAEPHLFFTRDEREYLRRLFKITTYIRAWRDNYVYIRRQPTWMLLKQHQTRSALKHERQADLAKRIQQPKSKYCPLD